MPDDRKRDIRFGVKDVIYIVTTVVTFTVSYTSMSNRVENNTARITENRRLIDTQAQVANILASIDKRLGIIEFRLDHPTSTKYENYPK